MEQDEIRAVILRSFDAVREDPEAFFEEEDFLRFLMADRRPLEAVRNGFRSLWRFNRFYDTLQSECGVCLSHKDTDVKWSVSALAAHIAKKKSNKSAQKALVRKRLKMAKSGLIGGTVKVGFFIALPFIALAWMPGQMFVFKVVLSLVGAGIFTGALYVQWREVLLYKRLHEIICA